MLEDFSLVDKRSLLQNKVDWERHSVLTFRKQPSHIILNVDKLMAGGYKSYEDLMRDIWLYLQ